MARLEERYASALLSVFEEDTQADTAGIVLEQLAQVMQQNREAQLFMRNPVIKPEAKKETLCMLAKKIEPKPPERLLHFLCLLIDRQRLDLLPGINTAYERLIKRKRNILVLEISSALPLQEAEVQKICAHFAKKYETEKTSVTVTVNPALLGGVRVQVGDMLYDGTLLGRMDELKRQIKSVS